MFRDCFAIFRPVKVQVDLFREKLSTGQLLYGTDPIADQEDDEPKSTFERAFDGSKLNIEKLKEVIGKMSPEEMAMVPELVKQIKSLLALRFDYINDKNKENVDRYVEDNHH